MTLDSSTASLVQAGRDASETTHDSSRLSARAGRMPHVPGRCSIVRGCFDTLTAIDSRGTDVRVAEASFARPAARVAEAGERVELVSSTIR